MTPDQFHDALHQEVGRPRSEWRTRLVGKTVIRELVQEPGAHRAPWASAQVNVQAHTIKVQINLNLKQNDLNQTDFIRLSALVLRGMARYWSRTTSIRNERFSVDVTGVQNQKNAVGVDLVLETGTDYARSYNLAILGIDASFIYNAGYFSSVVDADQDFMITSAHEFGHSVLTEYGGIGRSWTHEGSTSLFQSVKSSTPGYPASGEIDLMRYFDHKKAQVSFARQIKDSRATEFDVKCLLWMSVLRF